MPKSKYTKRADGRYMTTITINKKRRYIYGNTSEEVDEKIVELKHQKNNGIEIDDENITFKQWADRWLELYKKNITLSTLDMYKNNLRLYVYPQIGDMLLKSIKEHHVMKLLNDMSEHERSKEITLLTIKQILEKAVDNNYVVKNVVKNIKLNKHVAKEKNPLTDNHINKIAELDKKDTRAFLLLFMIYTGLRKEEVVLLKYNDINFDNDTLRVNKAYDFKHKVIKSTKNETTRYVPLLNNILPKLNEMKSIHQETDLIFPDSKNGIRSETSLRRLKEVMEKQLNFNFNYHQLRHTYACILYKAGIQPKQAQQWTGHKNIRVLLDIYTHLDKADNQQAFNQLNNFISNKSSDNILTTIAIENT